MNRLHFLIAWRYFKAKKSTNAINIIAWTSIVAIIIGTAALILVLSVFNGFEGLVKSLYSTFYTDLKIFPAQGKILRLSKADIQKLKSVSGIKNFSLVTEEKALLQNGELQSVVYLKGVDENYRYVTAVADHLVRGSFDPGSAENPKLILGAGVENAIGIISDRNLWALKIYLPRKSGGASFNLLEDISSDTIHSSGTFLIQQDFDNKYAITNIDFMKRAMKMEADQYSGVEIALHDPSRAREIKRQLSELLGTTYQVQTRYEQNRSLYVIMNIERWVIYGVLSLILVVAAFNMIGALTMLVLEKEKDISILHALGASRNFIRNIFLHEGMLLALIGGGIGMLLAFLIAWAQINFKLVPISGGSFLIDYFPVKLRLFDFLLVGATVFVIAFIASWLPSRQAALQQYSLRAE